MVNLLIKTITGTAAITLEDGQKVHDIIRPELAKGQIVTLDFDGVDVYASPFFNAAAGKLLGEFEAAFLNEHLKFEKISQVGLSVLRRSINTAREYFQNAQVRKAHDASIGRTAGAQ